MQEKIKWTIAILLMVIGLGGFFYEVFNPNHQRPKDEIVFRKCIDGKEYAMNNKSYKRLLMDENNNPLRCQ